MKRITMMMSIVLIAAVMIVLNSCDKKNATASGSSYKVRMTDAPGPYSQVNVDVQSVEVTGSNGTAMLNTHAGIYNLLQFSNGLDTLIAWGQLNVGTIQQVRLILGPNNSLAVNGTTHAMTVPSGEETGLKINVHQTLVAGDNILLVDFDATQSVVDEGNGNFHLKPVLRAVNIDAAASGSITGHISTAGTLAIVTVTGNGNTFSTGVAVNGYFMLAGLAAGAYTVTVTPALPLQPVTVSNVTVTAGTSTDIGMVTL
ncbi:MAG: hypothetical protein JWO03_2897 [Bacteroidetes bacterium]|nr:hypothetical protein [Bacteroidota bacterium]